MNIFTKILRIMGINKVISEPDNIDRRKVMANLLVLQYGSYKLAETFCKLDDEEKELLVFATESIKKIDPVLGIPLGFSYEFVATYPDVVLWWNNLSDEEQKKLLKNFNENDLLNEEKKIKQKYLKVLVDKYKNMNKKLECIIDNKEG